MTQTVRIKTTKDFGLQVVTNRQDTADIESIAYNRFSVQWSMYTVKETNDSVFDVSVDQNVSHQKIIHFIDNYLDNSLWYDPDAIPCIKQHFSSATNLLCITPSVNITILAYCLIAKFNSICKDNVNVEDLILLDHITGIEYEHNDIDMQTTLLKLPTVEDFVGEFSIYDQPWWLRNSTSTYDFSATDQEEQQKIMGEITENKLNMNDDFATIEKEVYEQMKSYYPESEDTRGQLIEVNFKDKKTKKLDE